MGLKHEVAEAERQVEIRSAQLQEHLYELRHSWRSRINPRALVLVGAAAGVVLEQFIRYRSHKPVVYELAPGDDRPPQKRSKHRISRAARALHLLPIAQLAVRKWLSREAERDERDQSPRSINFADHSITRKGNGLSRH
ncbi:MAG: hypothetical protein WD081_01630 [Gammaproteobacteria bacterium]